MTVAGSISDQVLKVLHEEEEAIMDMLKQLVDTESPSRVPSALKKIIDLITVEFHKLGYYTFYQPGETTGGFLYARPRNRDKAAPVQLLVGHCDTVWKLNTLFSMPLTEDEEKISGPGVYDMKAGITQMLYSIKILKKLGETPQVTPVILINTDEEIGSIESRRIITRLARLAERAYVMEPPLGLDGRLKTERKGVGRFTLKVKGKAAHAGLDPEKGVNAIVELSHQIQKLYAMNDPEKGITVNVGTITGGISPNVVAPEGTAVIDVRVNNAQDGAWISEQILGLTPQFPDSELLVEGRIGRPPMEATPRNQKLWDKAREKGTELGIDLKSGKAGGGSDGNFTSQYTATLDGLGTPGDGAHAPHEYILKQGLLERTALLTLLLLEPSLQGT